MLWHMPPPCAAQLCTRSKGQLGLAEQPVDIAHSEAVVRSGWCCTWLITSAKRADVSHAMASVAPARRLRHAHANLGGMCRSPLAPNRAKGLGSLAPPSARRGAGHWRRKARSRLFSRTTVR